MEGLLVIVIVVTGVFSDSVGPREENTNIIKEEGELVTLRCSYETESNYVWLYWFRQYPNGEPQFLLWKGARSESGGGHQPDRRFQSTTSQSSTELIINKADMSYSALYYCALRVVAHGSVRGVHWYRQYTGSPPQFLILEDSGATTEAIPPVPRVTINHRKEQSNRAKDAITPYSESTFATETESVKLSCNYSGSVESLHWYRQYAGSPPQFLILDYYGAKTEAVPPVSGISINHRKEASSVDLEISSAKVTDSALYYCALRPTVTGNTRHTIQKPDDVSLTVLSVRIGLDPVARGPVLSVQKEIQ
ncbi:unnamed protein product [Leuciscus chuanchicus]